jgi:long-chain acyl-CoA synthetase
MEKNLSMYAYLKESVQNLDEEKIIFQNNKISARKLFADIDCVSTFLSKLGITKGDSVGVCLPNIPQAVVAIYAINKLGAIVNAIHPQLKDDALYSALEKTNTKIVFMYDFMVLKHNKTLKSKGIKIVSCAYSDYLLGIKKFYKLGFIPYLDKNIYPYKKTLKKSKEISVEVDGRNDAFYLHSSGTAGESKTVRLSSNAFNALSDNIEQMITKNANVALSNGDIMLMTLPVFHGFGMGVCVHFSLHLFKICMVPFFKSKYLAKSLKNNDISFIVAVPNMLKKMVNDENIDKSYLKSVKLVFSGGDKLTDKVKDDFNNLLSQGGSKCKIMEGYGLSELTSVVSINIFPETNDSQGLPLPNVDIKIINDGKALPTLEIGEICVSSPSCMTGYLDNETAEFSEIDGKSYLHTGDLGCLDLGGFLHIKDRIKRIAIIGGINIYPQEVEALVCGINGVKACCIARYFDSGKTKTKAYIELDAGVKFTPRLQFLIKDTVEKKIMKYAVPSLFEQVEKIKLNKMGKVDFLYYENLQKGKI